jgi:hypothetical protein
MDSKQKRILLGVFAFVLLVWLISPLLLAVREAVPPASQSSLLFDAPRAYAATDEFVRKYPRRVLGSLESRQSTGFLHDRLAEMGYIISYTHFDARVDSRRQVGRNVLALKQGQSDEILAIIAHFDTARTTVQGATDNGSGVGVLLEMARIFADRPTRRSLLFIFSDGGEWGSLGARDIVESYSRRDRIAAVLSLNYVSGGDLAAFCLEETGQLKGFTPSWLRELARQAAEAQGLPVTAPSGIQEHFDRALLISSADQGPFLGAGIPAVNLGSISVNQNAEKARYHSPMDTIENLKIPSVEIYGRAAERIVRTLDELQSIPAESSGALRLWDSLYLRQAAIPVLHILAFLPFGVALYFYLKKHLGHVNSTGIGRELLVFLGTALPFFSIYFSIGLARALRKIPLYSLYPATAKDPVLQNPPWHVLGIIFGAALIIGVVFYAIGKLSMLDMPKPDFHESKMVLLAIMLIMIVLALLYNSYWATAFLLLPAWIWVLVGNGRTPAERIRNGILILAAGVPYFAALWIYASRLGMGWNFVWYQVLAVNSGLFSIQGFLLGMVAVVLGIRFLVVQIRTGFGRA